MTWTTDADGKYVDWLQPQYRQGPVMNFRLLGEDSISFEQLDKRYAEYRRLLRRAEERVAKEKAPQQRGLV